MIGNVLDLLLRGSLEAALVVAGVGLASLFLGGRASLRCRLWWAACLKLLVTLAGVAAWTLPILPVASLPPVLLHREPLANGAFAAGATAAPRVSWQAGLLAVYLTGVGIGAILTLRQLLRARRLVRGAEVVRDPRARRLLAELGRSLGLGRLPELAVSDRVRSPQVLRSLRPVILLPRAGLEDLDEAELAMVLAHELMHVRRRDLLLGWVPALARRLFFFHPGVWIAVREYVLAREAACDASVIRILGASPHRYARLLVETSVSGSRLPAPAAAMSSSYAGLRRRIRMLEQTTRATPRRRLGLAAAVVLAIAVLVPVRLGARTAPPSPQSTVPRATGSAERGTVDAYVFFLDDSSVAMSGSMEDLERARELRGSAGGELLWLRKGSREYVLRDPSTLKPIHELHAALEAGNADEHLGEKEEELQREQDRLTAEQDLLSAQAEALAQDAERLEQEREAAGEEGSRMEQQQQEQEREMERVEARLEELGAEQERRGAQVERISSQIELQIRELIEQAVRSGLAQRVRPAI